jgi:hypothetical protein
MNTTIQPINQQLIYPFLAIFETPDVERIVVEEDRRTGELVEIMTSGGKTSTYDRKSDSVQSQKVVVRIADPTAGTSYGSTWREQMLSSLDIWI